MMQCPSCGSKYTVKNGKIHNGKQNHKCRECNRQFAENREKKEITQETKTLIDRLLLEKIPLAGIARAVDVSEGWLQAYANAKYPSIPQQVTVKAKKKAN